MRWQTPDPLGFEDGLNLYAFFHNNPLRYQDHDGQVAIAIPFLIGVFGEGLTISVPTLYAIGGPIVGGALAWAVHRIDVWNDDDTRYLNEKTDENIDKNKDKTKPPYNGESLGEDPSVCPQEGFEWRGPGKPGSKQGGYFNPKTRERLRPDFHTPGHKPHWDYETSKPGGGKIEARLNTDGTWEWK